jgi:hypothetical protein
LTDIICISYINIIVAYLPKAITLEPEKLPLLANGSETTFVSRQRLSKHVPAATDMYATIEALLETVYSARSVQSGYKENSWVSRVNSVREAVKKRGRKRGSWKGVAVQRRLEPGSRELANVRSGYQTTTSEDIAGWKGLVNCGNQRWRCS